MVSVAEQVGKQLAGEKEAVAPEGSPETPETGKDMDSAVPEIIVAVIVLETDPPWVTVRSPPLESEKSKLVDGALTVREKVVVLESEAAAPVTVMV